MMAEVLLFPQHRRAGFIRRLAVHVVEVASSEKSLRSMIEASLRKQSETMARRGFDASTIDAAVSELRRAVEMEIDCILSDFPTNKGRRS